jgi:hypothetical protein
MITSYVSLASLPANCFNSPVIVTSSAEKKGELEGVLPSKTPLPHCKIAKNLVSGVSLGGKRVLEGASPSNTPFSISPA